MSKHLILVFVFFALEIWIDYLFIYLGYDIWDSGKDLSNIATSFLVRRISLAPDVQYFSNVIAYGFSGIHHTESSDGFKMDNSKPSAGVIYDGIGTENNWFLYI